MLVLLSGYADFQHPTKLDDPIVDISQAMREMDGERFFSPPFQPDLMLTPPHSRGYPRIPVPRDE